MNTSPPSNLPGYGQTNGSPGSQLQISYDGAPASGSSSSSVLRAAKGGGRQITRNRASYSCHTCRRRKVKCDKVHPICGNCVKNGTECVYDVAPQKTEESRSDQPKNGHGVKRRRQSSRPLEEDIDDIQSIYGHLKQTGASEQRSQAIEARLDKLTSMIERLSKTNQPLDPKEKQILAQNANLEPPKSDTRLGRGPTLKPPGGGSRPESPRRAADSSGDEFPIPAGHATDLVDPVGSLNLGHLSLEDGGRSRYVGTTYWAYISHEINELNQLLRDQNRSHNEAPANESSADEVMSEPMATAPNRHWKTSIDSTSEAAEESLTKGQSFQKSVLFPSGESPSVIDKVVVPEMLEHMPTKRQSHILYKGFMSGIHAITPVIHPPTILRLYNAFWNWYDSSSYSGEFCPDPSFIPLLYAIWFGGSVTISIRTIKSEFNLSSRSGLSKTYNEEVTRWLSKISFPRSPSLQGLAAYLIVQTILSKEEEPLTSSLFISLAMRVAQTMGLHRDPAKFGICPSDAEYRRRIWWHIVHMDGVVSMSSGLPPLVSDENYWDVRETSEVKDTILGSPSAEKYERLVMTGMRPPDNPDDPTICGGPSMVNVYYLSARGKYTMARAVRRIMKIQLGTKPVTRRDMEELRSILVDLQYKLNSIINRIPEVRSFDASSASSTRSWSLPSQSEAHSDTELPGDGPNGCSEQYHSPVLVSFHKWARIVMSLFIDKAFCVAYQPFLKNAKSRIWPVARQSALRHCHGFMEKFVALATDPEFQPFQWSWPGNHQPMHATMIMLIDLYERPYSPEASKSRAYIDRIFSLTGPDGGVVGGEDGVSTQRPLKDGGREAWDMIRRLRQKAWQRAGLDPHRLWSEQAQIQAGVTSVPDDPCYSSNTSVAGSPTAYAPATSRRQITDFSKVFYNMTRSHLLPNPTNNNLRPSPLRYQLPPPATASTQAQAQAQAQAPPKSLIHNSHSPQQQQHSPHLSSKNPLPSPVHPFPHPKACPRSTPPPAPPSFMDVAVSPNTQPMPGVPTPPSMVDPNLNFDWDQWDAVFGQHLPVADELMELDPVTGLEFGDLGSTRLPGARRTASLVGSEAGMSEAHGPDWVGYC
ncbi:Zn(II)2Cys6 transcription factor [Aspergillus heteromorphus CBS 117.55]|uniref:Zn(II)2Cys6 transcription factor n=1 Tax=Aspergillus heteromorphus CBS 117.55 TaxID=1448321 RepID=A0A317X0B0_9EURO|nr:Zn(II)2Cys6 transcription factor [Aspergillus heteromorphus CBS 117.55]PWY89930.1 Zn(II)2Cys6 transcription factor [Aspergillus heteromorphus CBS 117.55]